MSNHMFMDLFPEKDAVVEKAVLFMKDRKDVEFPKYNYSYDCHKVLLGFQKSHPVQLLGVFEEIAKEYDEKLKEFVDTFPLTTDIYWQTYRRNFMKFSLAVDYDNKISSEKNDKHLAKCLENFLEVCLPELCEEQGVCNIIDNPPWISLKTEPKYELLKRHPESVGGIGVYVFEIGDQDEPTTTIWDLREKQIPNFPRVSSLLLYN